MLNNLLNGGSSTTTLSPTTGKGSLRTSSSNDASNGNSGFGGISGLGGGSTSGG